MLAVSAEYSTFMRAGILPLYADRWTDFYITLEFSPVDLTDAIFAMQVRQYRDAPGEPLISLQTVTASAPDGVRLISVDTEASSSLISIKISEAVLSTLAMSNPIGGDIIFAWDLHVTPPGGIKQKWLAGDFTVVAGVTR